MRRRNGFGPARPATDGYGSTVGTSVASGKSLNNRASAGAIRGTSGQSGRGHGEIVAPPNWFIGRTSGGMGLALKGSKNGRSQYICAKTARTTMGRTRAGNKNTLVSVESPIARPGPRGAKEG